LHADKPGLLAAHTAVEDLAKYINETKKNYDDVKTMISSVKQVRRGATVHVPTSLGLCWFNLHLVE
jgi:hypothetical protein